MAGQEESGPGRVTEALTELRRGSADAEQQLFDVVYSELHRLAAAQMRRQPSGHTLQPTALVNEAYLRLMGAPDPSWNDRAHFLTAAARSMRSILVDFARRRGAQKRGGGQRKVTLDEKVHAGTHATEEIVAVHEALKKLEQIDPQGGRVVELRFFGGLTVEETAKVLGVSEPTVYRAWEHARSWLFREMGA